MVFHSYLLELTMQCLCRFPVPKHPFAVSSIASLINFPEQHLRAVSRRYTFSETWMRVWPHVWLLTSTAKNSVWGGAKQPFICRPVQLLSFTLRKI